MLEPRILLRAAAPLLLVGCVVETAPAEHDEAAPLLALDGHALPHGIALTISGEQPFVVLATDVPETWGVGFPTLAIRTEWGEVAAAMEVDRTVVPRALLDQVGARHTLVSHDGVVCDVQLLDLRLLRRDARADLYFDDPPEDDGLAEEIWQDDDRTVLAASFEPAEACRDALWAYRTDAAAEGLFLPTSGALEDRDPNPTDRILDAVRALPLYAQIQRQYEQVRSTDAPAQWEELAAIDLRVFRSLSGAEELVHVAIDTGSDCGDSGYRMYALVTVEGGTIRVVDVSEGFSGAEGFVWNGTDDEPAAIGYQSITDGLTEVNLVVETPYICPC